MSSKVTIRQVAAQADVSIGTVSRVLNRHNNVSSENVTRVKKAVKELGYRPRLNGSTVVYPSRKRLRTGNICLFFSDCGTSWIENPIVVDTFRGADRACREYGFHLLLEMGEPDGRKVPRCLSENRVDGILLRASGQIPGFVREYAPEVPFVGITSKPENLPIHQVRPSHRSGAYEVTGYLWNQGHRRIAFVAREGSHAAFLARLGGYEEFMRSVGAYHPEWVKLGSSVASSVPLVDHPNVDELLQPLWDMPRELRPTAIVVGNDWTAAGIYAFAERKGISIPEDLSLVSFDNIDLCTQLKPQLTSYDLSFENVAHTATQVLYRMLLHPCGNEQSRSCTQVVLGKLYKRQSVRRLDCSNELTSLHGDAPSYSDD